LGRPLLLLPEKPPANREGGNEKKCSEGFHAMCRPRL
jgi:hypothetical protein